MKFRKKPVVVEAIQWTDQNIEEIKKFLGQKAVSSARLVHDKISDDQHNIYISTLEGEMTARVNDWIICGVQGEFYPCKPDIFELTYEKVQ